MNDEHRLLWLDFLQFSLQGTSTAQGLKAETIVKKAASIADAALEQYRMRFELPPEQPPQAPAEPDGDEAF